MESVPEHIIEGSTRLVIPAVSIDTGIPPRHPAFFNPRAARTRDMTVLACRAHAEQSKKRIKFADAMAGVGARGLRVAKEAAADTVYLNDVNTSAIHMARQGAALNNIDNIYFSEMPICSFLARHSVRGSRVDVVDLDPFGSPAPYIDCGIRATTSGGILAVTATDLQVLGGLYNEACMRIYGGISIRSVCTAEIAVRLILSCLNTVAGRLGNGIRPLYVESYMHYYRIYSRLLQTPTHNRMGYLLCCVACGEHQLTGIYEQRCNVCGSTGQASGPLWTGNLFDAEFVDHMKKSDTDGRYQVFLETCSVEATVESPQAVGFYTLDEIGSLIKDGPPPLSSLVQALHRRGFSAAPTSFTPTGFRTDADMASICNTAKLVKSKSD